MSKLAPLLLALSFVAPAHADPSALEQLGAWSGRPVSSLSEGTRTLKTSVSRPRRPLDPEDYKPSGMASPAAARRMCATLSRQAAARGVSTLVIGFEGFLSFDSFGTSAAYRYQMGQGRRPLPFLVPGLGGGYLLHGLILPLVDHYGSSFEFLLYRHLEQSDDDGSVPAVCARAWTRGAPAGQARHIVVIGHSMGTTSASLLARSLARSHIPVDLVVTINAFPAPPARSSNVIRWENYRQPIPVPGADAYIPDAEVNRMVSTANHLSLPGDPAVVDAVSRSLGALISGVAASR